MFRSLVILILEATKIIGKTLYTNLVGGQGERKQNPDKFTPNEE